jgi:hypothetical protein
MTTEKHLHETTQTSLERILDTVESIDRVVDEIRDQLKDLCDQAAYASWPDERYGWNHGPD